VWEQVSGLLPAAVKHREGNDEPQAPECWHALAPMAGRLPNRRAAGRHATLHGHGKRRTPRQSPGGASHHPAALAPTPSPCPPPRWTPWSGRSSC